MIALRAPILHLPLKLHVLCHAKLQFHPILTLGLLMRLVWPVRCLLKKHLHNWS